MKNREREQAVEMRRQGVSYKSIAKALGVSPSSALRWTRDVVLTKKAQAVVDSMSTSTAAAARRREEFQKLGRRKARHDPAFRVLCALYWGEGRKRFHHSHKEEFSFTNSDPAMVAIVSQWLVKEGYRDRIYLKVKSPKRVEKKKLMNYWHGVIGFPAKTCVSFAIPVSSKKRRGDRTPFGTAALNICDKRLIHEVLGGIEEIKDVGIA